MSLADCIETAFRDGEISAEERADLRETYARFERQYRLDMSEADAAAEAGRATMEALRIEAVERKRRVYLQAAVQRRLAGQLQSFRNRRGQLDVAQGLLETLEPLAGGMDSVEGRRRAIVGQAHARMEELLHTFRKGWDGRPVDRAKLDDVVRELFGQQTGDEAARRLAASWSDVADALRRRFNAAGGAIHKLEDWGLPQAHDARALRKAGFEAWAADIFPRLAPERMREPLTGRAMTPAQVRDALRPVYDAIVSEGLNTIEPSGAPMGAGALAKRRADHRFLVFKSPDDWIDYARSFGAGEPWATMMTHINVMARDVAALEVMGPNPRATLTWMQAIVRDEAGKRARGADARIPAKSAWRELGQWAATAAGKSDDEATDALAYAEGAIKRSEDMWAHISGSANAPVREDVALTLATGRSLTTAAALGSAVFSSVTDVGTNMLTRAFNGLPVWQTVADTVALWRPQEAASRREAIAAGLIAESALHVFGNAARQAGVLSAARETSALLADRVLAAGLLTPWTIALRHSFGLAFMRETARLADEPMSALPDAFRRTLERYGFSAADWDALRRGPIYQRDGVTFLRPSDLAGAEALEPDMRPDGQGELDVSLDAAARQVERRQTGRRALAERYLDMILAETEYATPSGSVRARSLLQGDARPGTFQGEFWRSFSQFKTFGVSIVMLHGYRMFGEGMAGRAQSLMGYGLAYASTMIVGGALALQMKEIAKGRDPLPMDTQAFWTGAAFQGGGFGIFGDFLYASNSMLGNGLEKVLAGPLAGRVSDFLDLTVGNAIGLAEGEDDDNAGRELVRTLKSSTPGGSLWYARLGAERLWWDQLQRLIDPDAQDAFDRAVDRAERERDQDYWWAPGETAPERLPGAGAP
jgi:hypothetical protein